MIKKFTGVRFTPQEFRLLNQCLYCGKAGQFEEGETCADCSKVVLKNCDMCEVLLRNGKYKFYTYDIKVDHRGGETGFKVSKEYVREFEYTTEFKNPENPECLCADCVGWEAGMKHRCRSCHSSFVNDKENYKENGNYCKECSAIIESKSHEQEAGNN